MNPHTVIDTPENLRQIQLESANYCVKVCNDTNVKALLNTISEFLNRTVYGGMCFALRSQYGIFMILEDEPNAKINTSIAPMNPHIYELSAVNRMKREIVKMQFPHPYFHNPPVSKPTTIKSLYENTLEMRFDIELEATVRRSVGKLTADFIKTIVNKFYFNPKLPTNLEWKKRVLKLTEMIMLESGERRLEVKTGAISHNMRYMEHIYHMCFGSFIQKQNAPENEHKYIYSMTNKINTFASIINNFGKGQNSALSLTFLCFKDVAEYKTFEDFTKELLNFNPGDFIFANILEFDMAKVFGNTTKLFKLLNPDGLFNNTCTQNALLIADVACDLLPIMLCEMLLFMVLYHVAMKYSSVYEKMIIRFKKAYDNGQGCFTVLQSFPGLFSILCYVAKRYGGHDLEFLSILEGICSSRGLNRTRYISHLKKVAVDLGIICLELLDSIMRFDLPRMISDFEVKILRQRYYDFNLGEFEQHFRNSTFLITNTFVV